MSNEDVPVVDARGLSCPQPVLRVRERLRAMAPGEHVVLLATDPLASVDVRAFCARAGHAFLAEEQAEDHRRFTLARGG